MLKLIYHTGVFGPIDLEYRKPIVRVGSSEDNDLVLRHPSVKPFHGLLVFRGERVLLMPPSKELPLETDLLDVTATEYGAGEQLLIGDLQFSLAYSSTSVALPDFLAPGGARVLPSREDCHTPGITETEAEPAVGESMQLEKGSPSPRPIGDFIVTEASSPAPGEEGRMSSHGALTEEQLYCSNCRTFVAVDRVKRIGLVGQAKLALCPKCSRALQAQPASPLKTTMPEIERENPKKGFVGILKGMMKSTSRISLS